MPRNVQRWDKETHEDLLVVLCAHLKPNNQDYTAIWQLMREKGYTFTEGALTYVFTFLTFHNLDRLNRAALK